MIRIPPSLHPANWSLRTIIIVGSVVYVGLGLLVVEPIARATILKKFYHDVATASQYSRQLPFNHFVAGAESDGDDNVRHGMHFTNCSQAGTYRNYETNETINGAFMCSKKFTSVYGVDSLDSRTVSHLRDEMLAAGWIQEDTSGNADEQLAEMQTQADGTVRGSTFKRGDRVNASMIFLIRNSSDYQSWCRNAPAGCRAFEKADTAHRNIVVVEVSAFRDYAD